MQLHGGSGADQSTAGKILIEHISECNLNGLYAELGCQLMGPLAAFQIIRRAPNTVHFGICRVGAVAGGREPRLFPIQEKTACLR